MTFLAFAIGPAVTFAMILVSVAASWDRLKVLALHLGKKQMWERSAETAREFHKFGIPNAGLSLEVSAAQEAPPLQNYPLSGNGLRRAVQGMVDFAESVQPDWILGVHAPGRLLSVYIAEKLGIPLERCVYVGTQKGAANGVSLAEHGPLSGRILIVDDVTRSGQTMAAVKTYLLDRDQDGLADISAVFAAVLVVNTDYDIVKWSSSAVDWMAYCTGEFYYTLPWSGLSMRIRHADEKDKKPGLKLTLQDRMALDVRARLIEEAGFALDQATRYIDQNGQARRSVARPKMGEKRSNKKPRKPPLQMHPRGKPRRKVIVPQKRRAQEPM